MTPPVLYKYMRPGLISALAERELRFTPPSEFNDPFEAYPRVSGPNRESVRKKLKPGDDLDDLVARATPFFQKEGPQMVLDEVSRTFGVLCLAGCPDNPLLWAHYTDGHRGFAIGFDSNHPWFNLWDPPMPPIDRLQEVVYARDRPFVRVGDHDDFEPGELEAQARAMVCTKFTAWQYEEEWRLIRPLNRADRTTVQADGSSIHLFRFPGDAVIEVILGARMTEPDKGRLRSALPRGGLTKPRIRGARRSSASYLLEIVDLDSA